MTTATETRPDITISSRITDFNVQISAVNTHSLVHYTVMNGIEQTVNKNSEQIWPLIDE